MFTERDQWNGGHFELCIDLGRASDDQVFEAMSVLWGHPSLEGCYLRQDEEPSKQQRLDPTSQPLEALLYGVAALDRQTRVPCLSTVMRLEGEPVELGLCVPMGALQAFYQVGAYPFAAAGPWLEPLSDWFAGIGKTVLSAGLSRVALVGFETSTLDVQERFARCLERGIPERRWDGYLLRKGDRVVWRRPNIYDAQLTVGPCIG